MGAVSCRLPSGLGLLTPAGRMVRRGDSGPRGFTRRHPSLPVMSRRYNSGAAAVLVGADRGRQ